jgi:hypothetical protein
LERLKNVKHEMQDFRLDPEENCAISNFIEKYSKMEEHLNRYNILKVRARFGYLMPQEPIFPVNITANGVQEPVHIDRDELGVPIVHYDDGEDGRWWLDDQNDYDPLATTNNESKQRGHNKFLDDFRDCKPYVENRFKERLVYKHRPGRWWRLFGRFSKAGTDSGEVEWMKEPEDGWKGFEMKHFRMEEAAEELAAYRLDSRTSSDLKTSLSASSSTGDDGKKIERSKFYADKWQRVIHDFWHRPWSMDEKADEDFKFLCWKIDPRKLFGKRTWYTMRKEHLRYFRHYVPRKVSLDERNEIRKYFYTELMKCTYLKLKVAYCADAHPKFYDWLSPSEGDEEAEDDSDDAPRTLEAIANESFKTILHDIRYATVKWPPLEGRRSTTIPNELYDYMIMKFESVEEDSGEPWWAETDRPMHGEIRVMFDRDMFWREQTDARLKDYHEHNDLVPREGYHMSPHLHSQSLKDAKVAIKRFKLCKPDGSYSETELNVQMEHVVPLMRYTKSFKANVKQDTLDMPVRTMYSRLIGNKKRGTQFNFVIERFLILVSTLIMSAQEGVNSGFLTAICILSSTIVSYVVTLVFTIQSQIDEEEEALEDEAAGDAARVKLDEDEEQKKRLTKARESTMLANIGASMSLSPAASPREPAASPRESTLGSTGTSAGENDPLTGGWEDDEGLPQDSGVLGQCWNNGIGSRIIATTFSEVEVVVLFFQAMSLALIVGACKHGDFRSQLKYGFWLMFVTTFLMVLVGTLTAGSALREKLE